MATELLFIRLALVSWVVALVVFALASGGRQ